MVPRVISTGAGVKGLLAYCMHDAGTKENPKPKTAERVAFASTINCPTDDVNLAARIMQGTVADANLLKQQAKIRPGGRHLQSPYVHWSLSWHPDEKPTGGEMREAAMGALKALGLGNRMSIIIGHSDTDHRHTHGISCRVSRENGVAAKLSHSHQRLSTFASTWEEEHGGILIPARVERQKARAEFAAEVDAQMAHFQPTPGISKTAAARERRLRRKAVVADLKKKKPPLPATAGPRAEPGRRTRHPVETKRWADLYEGLGATKATPAQAKAAKRQLAAELEREYEQREQIKRRGVSDQTRADVDRVHQRPATYQVPSGTWPVRPGTTPARGDEGRPGRKVDRSEP